MCFFDGRNSPHVKFHITYSANWSVRGSLLLSENFMFTSIHHWPMIGLNHFKEAISFILSAHHTCCCNGMLWSLMVSDLFPLMKCKQLLIIHCLDQMRRIESGLFIWGICYAMYAMKAYPLFKQDETVRFYPVHSWYSVPSSGAKRIKNFAG